MAVVQISRIQVRRGKANEGTGIPQLASGELAWALDTQQLYIGNGAVAEGAPAVGNTKILTEKDLNVQGNILDLIQHVYKVNDPSIQTGASGASPVVRPLQDRLDDRVTLADFVDPSDWYTTDYDYTLDLQRAINQLFFNPTTPAWTDTAAGSEARVILELPPGKFKITNTIYIPSYATIVGAGSDKTIIEYTGSGTAVRFINDTAEIGDTVGNDTIAPDSISNATYTTQPRYITLSNLTVHSKTSTTTALQLDCVRDSRFENINVQGDWPLLDDDDAPIFALNSKGIALNALSSVVTCERNTFKDVRITGFQSAVYAPQDIARNTFNSMFVNNVYDGFIFGARFAGSTNVLQEVDGTTTGEQYGPRSNVITESVLGDKSHGGIYRHALFVGKGSTNTISDSKLINVGHEGANAENPALFPQIYFTSTSNTVTNVSSDRTSVASNPETAFSYVPEVAGTSEFNSHGTAFVRFSGSSSTPLPGFKLPLSTDRNGNPRGRNSFVVTYIFKNDAADNFVRQGSLFITADADNEVIQLTDEYNFAGVDDSSELVLDFSAVLVDGNNNDYTDPETQSIAAIMVKYSNLPESGILYYSYKSFTYDSGIIPTV